MQVVIDAARRSDPEVEVRRIRTTDLVPGELNELVSPSLFAQGRVVVLGAAHEVGKDIADALLDHARHLSQAAHGIVLFSAWLNDEERARYGRLHVDALIDKPPRPGELVRTVNELAAAAA